MFSGVLCSLVVSIRYKYRINEILYSWWFWCLNYIIDSVSFSIQVICILRSACLLLVFICLTNWFYLRSLTEHFDQHCSGAVCSLLYAKHYYALVPRSELMLLTMSYALCLLHGNLLILSRLCACIWILSCLWRDLRILHPLAIE